MNRSLLVVSLAVAVLTGAWASGDSSSRAISSAPSVSSEPASPSPDATPVRTTPAEQPEPSASPSRSAQDVADGAVLTLDLLGERGWEEVGDGDPEAAPGQRSDNPSCSYQSTALRPASAVATGARGFAFQPSDSAESLTSQALVYASDSEAAAAFADAQQLAAQCGQWRSGGVEGEDYAFRQRQQTFAADGSEAVGRERAVRHARTALSR